MPTNPQSKNLRIYWGTSGFETSLKATAIEPLGTGCWAIRGKAGEISEENCLFLIGLSKDFLPQTKDFGLTKGYFERGIGRNMHAPEATQSSAFCIESLSRGWIRHGQKTPATTGNHTKNKNTWFNKPDSLPCSCEEMPPLTTQRRREVPPTVYADTRLSTSHRPIIMALMTASRLETWGLTPKQASLLLHGEPHLPAIQEGSYVCLHKKGGIR